MKLNVLIAVALMGTAALVSCDTPQSVAWSYYDLAQDKLNEGKPEEAKEVLLKVKKNVSSDLDAKVDSLMTVIQQQLAETNDNN
ncbi:MAG: hypothetical protein II750_02280 [Bacteroidaceae bacterium]|nr:hypothetical protein [Bacteroidaceae bacterium]